ncbi:MAG: hypothetical protein R2856_15135 [Caldilineaceae bacterium]
MLVLDDVVLAGSSTAPTPTPTTTTAPPSPTPSVTPITGGIDNGDFDLGPNGDWDESSVLFGGTGSLIMSSNDLPEGLLPHSGNYAVWLGGGYNEEATLAQSVAFGGDVEELIYQYWIGSADLCGYDFLYVKIGDQEDRSLRSMWRQQHRWLGGETHRCPLLRRYTGNSLLLHHYR